MAESSIFLVERHTKNFDLPFYPSQTKEHVKKPINPENQLNPLRNKNVMGKTPMATSISAKNGIFSFFPYISIKDEPIPKHLYTIR